MVTASVCWFLVCNGSPSKAMNGASASPASANAPKQARIGQCIRRTSGSIRRSAITPTSSPSGCGRNATSRAGSTVSVHRKAISMPPPAITPSCATPTKLVGVKARKPLAVARAATSTCAPDSRPVSPSASIIRGWMRRRSRKRTVNCMAKSTAMPTNRMAKATEIRFSVPTAAAANPVVSTRPSSSVMAIGTTRRQEPTAANSQTTTRTKLPPNPTAAPCATEENSSSSSATEPVMRTRADPSFT